MWKGGALIPRSLRVVRIAVSFDKFSRGVKSIVSSSSEKGYAPSAMPAKSKQLLFILLQRGPNGLGLELDATNTVVNLVPGGAASVLDF